MATSRNRRRPPRLKAQRSKRHRKRPRRKRVIVALTYSDTRLFRGIARYARQAGWSLNTLMWYLQQPPGPSGNDGIIAMHERREEMYDYLRTSALPTVNIGGFVEEMPLPTVSPDYFAAGRLAAEHFLERGIENVAYALWEPGTSWQGGLADGLRTGLARAGRELHVFDGSHLRDEIARLPKPVGIMMPNDISAVWAIEHLQTLEIAVPEEVAVLGFGDDEVQGETAPVPLSSIDINPEELGYQAAKLLDRIMSGRRRSAAEKPVIVPPKGVIRRRSTDYLGIPHIPSAEAMAFILAHYTEPITPDDVARQSGMCRRRLEEPFAKHVGRSITREIQRLRLRDACRMLTGTNLKCHQIARACGFGNILRMNRTFNTLLACTPTQWRLRHGQEA